MLCSICKERDATVHVTSINSDKMQKQDLCPDCAKTNMVMDPNAVHLGDLISMLKAVEEKKISEADLLSALKVGAGERRISE